MTAHSNQYNLDECLRASAVLGRIGEKWSALIVVVLQGEPRRFNEMKRIVPGISQQMLTRVLRGVERDGLLTRTVYPTTPPQVEYELTEMGKSLVVPMIALGTWALRHVGTIEAAQAEYDSKHQTARSEVSTSV